MHDRPGLLDRLREILGRGEVRGRRAEDPGSSDGAPTPGCEDVEAIPCEEAARRVYEYLDGELASDAAEEVRCHLEQCERCYPMYDWERMFLDVLRVRGDRPEPSDELRRRVSLLLEREAG